MFFFETRCIYNGIFEALQRLHITDRTAAQKKLYNNSNLKPNEKPINALDWQLQLALLTADELMSTDRPVAQQRHTESLSEC